MLEMTVISFDLLYGCDKNVYKNKMCLSHLVEWNWGEVGVFISK